MSKLLEYMAKTEDFCSLGAVSLSQVQSAESKLGLSFAKEYIEYVMEYGAASLGTHELTGICGSQRISVVSTTSRARKVFPRFPKGAYVVEELNIDHMIIIQDKSGKIYTYGPQDNQTKIANSLLEYLIAD